MRPLHTAIYCCVPAILLAFACSGGGDLAGAGSRSKSKDSDDGDKETDKADVPQEVAGAFLTCGPSDSYKQGDATVEPYGCAIMKDDTKLPDRVRRASVKLRKKDGGTYTPVQQIAPDESKWHVEYAIPVAMKPELEGIDLVLAVGDVRFEAHPGLQQPGGTGDLTKWSIAIPIGGGAVAAVTIPDNLEDAEISIENTQTATMTSTTTSTGTGTGTGTTVTFKHYVFVSSQQYSPGDNGMPTISGYNDAEARCATLADSADDTNPVLPKANTVQWKAVLGDDDDTAAGHLGALVGDVYDSKDTKVMTKSGGWTGATTGIGFDEAGAPIPTSELVWTGWKNAGESTATTQCDGWDAIDANKKGVVGDPHDKNKLVNTGTPLACGDGTVGQKAHLYCISFPK